MALTLNIETKESFEFEECSALLERPLDPDDYDSLADAAVVLKKLANNRRLLIPYVNDNLLNWKSENNNALGDTAFCLARKGPLCIRANVWIPPAEVAANGRWQANIRSYLTPHDHAFSFVTVGYLGPGYATTIFEYDRSRIRGELGEQVVLQPLETTTLPQGKVMIYRASRDVHFQAHPEKFSISLNLMVFPRETREQYGFDIAANRITARAVDFRNAQATLCKMAAALGDGRTSNVLEQVATRNGDAEIRLNAFAAWARIERTRAAEIWAAALSDPHESVHLRARAELAFLA